MKDFEGLKTVDEVQAAVRPVVRAKLREQKAKLREQKKSEKHTVLKKDLVSI
jgi:hypothetical protein